MKDFFFLISDMCILKLKVIIYLLNLFCFLTSLPLSLPVKDWKAEYKGQRRARGNEDVYTKVVICLKEFPVTLV